MRAHNFELEHLFDSLDEGPFFADVAFDISDIKRNWPKPGPAKLPAPSEAKVREFWKQYVAKHDDPDKHPTAAEQKLAAESWFNSKGYSGPSDKGLKELRRFSPTPEHWREKGRPLKTDR